MSVLKRLFRLSVSTLTGSLMLMFIVAAGILALGVATTGGLEEWSAALKTAAPYLLVWRVVLYAGIGSVWLRLYRRHKQNNDREGLSRVTRIGWCGATMACLVELSQFIQG